MYTLNIERRNLKKKSHELRDNGFLPGTIYGPKIKSTPIKASLQEIKKAVNKPGEVYQVVSENGPVLVRFDEVQRDAVNQELIHFSLVQMPKGVESHISVPIEVMGKAEGAKKGGSLVMMKDEVTLKGTPSSIPESLIADISGLDIGDKLMLSELKLPMGVEFIEDADDVVAICKPPVLQTELDTEENSLQSES